MKRLSFSESGSLDWPLPAGAARLAWATRAGETHLTVSVSYSGAYGMGEKYDSLNQKGHRVKNLVEEKFCFQGGHTYCPAPFFWTDTGFGFYAATDRITEFSFEEDVICISLPAGCGAVLFSGKPEEMIREYMSLFGPAKLPPKWAFGPWISANHWNSQSAVEAQLENLRRRHCPATVLVAEAWSDEATFSVFNGAHYALLPEEGPCGEEFDLSGSPWPDPKGMIRKLHDAGVHFVLWQVPVYKKQGPEEPPCPQNDRDREEAVRLGLCVHNADGTPYTIPGGHWFAGSMVPDFTNPETVKRWFARRQYLLDWGVDGFKTDGGEFICSDNARFADGSTGLEGRNRYPQQYAAAYSDFIGPDRVLFSRAGWAGQHTTPCHWAGDQQSQNSELTGALRAGLSAALTGISFWGFDIAGFAGPLPTPDLYRRAVMLACFCPIMQWHSEPDGGQFRELMPGGEGNNERSPWNMESAWAVPGFAEEMAFWHRLRMNLLPYLYSEAVRSAAENRPLMRPLVYHWPRSGEARAAWDEFLLGESLLVAPLLEENQTGRTLWLPQGGWYSLFTGQRFEGGQTVTAGPELTFPVFLREGCALALDLPKGAPLGADAGTDTASLPRLVLAGEAGEHALRAVPDAPPLVIRWNGEQVQLPAELAHAEVIRWR